MTTGPIFLRTQLVFALVLPMALILGYLLATPYDISSVGMTGLVFLVLTLPLLLKWYHPLLFIFWNLPSMAFFLPGSPEMWMVVGAAGFTVSLAQRAMLADMRFISTPSVLAPVFFLMIVIALTGQFTGGIGLRALGGSTVGGKNYLYFFVSTCGLLAMLSYRVPKEKVRRYLKFFFLAPLVSSIGILAPLLPPAFYFLFLFFPVTGNDVTWLNALEEGSGGIARLGALSTAAMNALYFVLAWWGVRRMLEPEKFWRLLLFVGLLALVAMGGFRSFLISCILTFFVLFWLEGLFRTKYAAMLLAAAILGGTLIIPLANRLPLPIQRSIAFLPLNLDPTAVFEARNSTEWRLNLWKMAADQIPRYFWFGKGMGVDAEEMASTVALSNRGKLASDESFLLVQNFHNGPLSVIIPLGIWGAIGWLWLVIAILRALYKNYRYGDEELKRINTFFLAYFIMHVLVFLIVFGHFPLAYPVWMGIIGISLCLNHGICEPAQEPAPESLPLAAQPPAAGREKPAGSRLMGI